MAVIEILGCHPNRPQGAPVAALLENPGLFNCALSLVGYVSVNAVTGAKACRCAVPSLIFEPKVSEPLRSANFLIAPYWVFKDILFRHFFIAIIFLLNVTSM
ncbi:hypothetical protein [Rahnella selenatireducens]|uniref:hypothetical protein n=1 Tax=Rahnella selenatireducens TaxID=3389797 RepID=UPI003969AF7B